MFSRSARLSLPAGWTHLMEVWTLWEPRYWLAGDLKFITAVASVATGAWRCRRSFARTRARPGREGLARAQAASSSPPTTS